MEQCHHFYKKADGSFIPNPHHLEDTVGVHTRIVYAMTDAIPSCLPYKDDLQILALLHDIGKPMMKTQTEEAINETPKTRFFGHEYCSALRSINFLKKHYQGEKLIKMLNVITLHLIRDKDCLKVREYTNDEETLRLHMGLSMCDTFGRISDDNYKNEYDNIPKLFASIQDEPKVINDISGKQTFTMLIGVPGTTKSSHAANYGKVFSPDAKLLELFPAATYNKSFALGKDSSINWVEQSFLNLEQHARTTKENVVWDATNLSAKRRRGLIIRARKLNMAIKYVIFWRDLEECLACRCAGDKFLSLDTFKQMMANFSYPKMNEYDVLENVIV